MSETANTAIAVIGIDIGKNSLHVVGHDARGTGRFFSRLQEGVRDCAGYMATIK